MFVQSHFQLVRHQATSSSTPFPPNHRHQKSSCEVIKGQSSRDKLTRASSQRGLFLGEAHQPITYDQRNKTPCASLKALGQAHQGHRNRSKTISTVINNSRSTIESCSALLRSASESSEPNRRLSLLQVPPSERVATESNSFEDKLTQTEPTFALACNLLNCERPRREAKARFPSGIRKRDFWFAKRRRRQRWRQLNRSASALEVTRTASGLAFFFKPTEPVLLRAGAGTQTNGNKSSIGERKIWRLHSEGRLSRASGSSRALLQTWMNFSAVLWSNALQSSKQTVCCLATFCLDFLQFQWVSCRSILGQESSLASTKDWHQLTGSGQLGLEPLNSAMDDALRVRLFSAGEHEAAPDLKRAQRLSVHADGHATSRQLAYNHSFDTGQLHVKRALDSQRQAPTAAGSIQVQAGFGRNSFQRHHVLKYRRNALNAAECAANSERAAATMLQCNNCIQSGQQQPVVLMAPQKYRDQLPKLPAVYYGAYVRQPETSLQLLESFCANQGRACESCCCPFCLEKLALAQTRLAQSQQPPLDGARHRAPGFHQHSSSKCNVGYVALQGDQFLSNQAPGITGQSSALLWHLGGSFDAGAGLGQEGQGAGIAESDMQYHQACGLGNYILETGLDCNRHSLSASSPTLCSGNTKTWTGFAHQKAQGPSQPWQTPNGFPADPLERPQLFAFGQTTSQSASSSCFGQREGKPEGTGLIEPLNGHQHWVGRAAFARHHSQESDRSHSSSLESSRVWTAIKDRKAGLREDCRMQAPTPELSGRRPSSLVGSDSELYRRQAGATSAPTTAICSNSSSGSFSPKTGKFGTKWMRFEMEGQPDGPCTIYQPHHRQAWRDWQQCWPSLNAATKHQTTTAPATAAALASASVASRHLTRQVSSATLTVTSSAVAGTSVESARGKRANDESGPFLVGRLSTATSGRDANGPVRASKSDSGATAAKKPSARANQTLWRGTIKAPTFTSQIASNTCNLVNNMTSARLSSLSVRAATKATNQSEDASLGASYEGGAYGEPAKGSGSTNASSLPSVKSNSHPQHAIGAAAASLRGKVSLAGAKRRLGFKQKFGLNSLSVHRSEEVFPFEASGFFAQQMLRTSSSSNNTNTPATTAPNSLNNSSDLELLSNWQNQFAAPSAQDPRVCFVEGLGRGQIASRQALVSPYLGDIQMSLSDRRGMLEVEIIRARQLQPKPSAKQLPSPYVKVYLMKEKKCLAKFKTNQMRRTLNPLYQQLFIFRENYSDCVLQIIVWGSYGKRDRKCLLGIVQVYLNDLEMSASVVVGWYRLFNAPSMVANAASVGSSKTLRQTLSSGRLGELGIFQQAQLEALSQQSHEFADERSHSNE